MFIFCDVAIIKYNLSETEAPDYGPCLQWLKICAVPESQLLKSEANYAGEDDWLFFRGLVPENFSSAVIRGVIGSASGCTWEPRVDAPMRM